MGCSPPPPRSLRDVGAQTLNPKPKAMSSRPRSVIEEAEVEEFTLGMVPPKFHSCFASYSPDRKYLQFELDTDFASSGTSPPRAPVGCPIRHRALPPPATRRVQRVDPRPSFP